MQPTQSDKTTLSTTINHLIDTAKDGENGFLAAARDCTNSDLKHLFSQLSRERAVFSTKLKPFVEKSDIDSEPGTLAAAVHRGWINLKSTVASRENLAVLEECERGEEYAQQQYTDALATLELGHATDTVQSQADSIRKSHNRVKSFLTKFQVTPAAH